MRMEDQRKNFTKKLWGIFLMSAFLCIGANGLYGGEYDQFLTEETKGAQFVGTETCAACHEETVKNFQLSAHARIQIDNDLHHLIKLCYLFLIKIKKKKNNKLINQF